MTEAPSTVDLIETFLETKTVESLTTGMAQWDTDAKVTKLKGPHTLETAFRAILAQSGGTEDTVGPPSIDEGFHAYEQWEKGSQSVQFNYDGEDLKWTTKVEEWRAYVTQFAKDCTRYYGIYKNAHKPGCICIWVWKPNVKNTCYILSDKD